VRSSLLLLRAYTHVRFPIFAIIKRRIDSHTIVIIVVLIEMSVIYARAHVCPEFEIHVIRFRGIEIEIYYNTYNI